MAKATDPKELLKALEAEEAEAMKEFETKLKEQREKKMAAVIDPLKKERGELAAQRNDIDIRIAELDKQISALTGVKVKGGMGSSGKRRKRMTDEEKLQVATIMYGAMNKGKEYSAGDLENSADGLPVARLVDIWNAAHKDKKIAVTGNRATRRYVK